jgi:hypothetical protein
VSEKESREPHEAPPKLRCYREVAAIVAFYGVYSVVRNQFGSNAAGPAHAFHNAEHVIAVQKALGLFVEIHIQHAFLGWGRGFFWFWNVYYGTLHFVVTAGVLIWVYRRHADRYPRWRNTLGATTALALVGFSAFPLMPPRLLDAGGVYGWSSGYHFVDTLARFGGPWSFDSGTVQSVSNQYAAMPSLHVGWSLWCCCAMYPVLRHRWSRALVLAYPPTTTFAIVVTGNHYWLDAAGGALVFAVAYVVAGRWELAKARLRANRGTEPDGVLVS